MDRVHTKEAPAAIGPYSQAYVSRGFLLASGQLGIDPKSGTLEDGIIGQTKRAITNAGAVLKAAGLDYKNVVKTTCFLKDIADFGTFNEIYGKYFSEKPARSCFQVAALPKDALVEIEFIAEL